MAEAILRAREIDGVEVRSAGIHAFDGMPIAAHAKTLIEQANMPSGKTANAITKENVMWADVILTMTSMHKKTLHQLFPNEKSKIHTLKGFLAQGEHEDVHDPFGGTLETYRETFQELTKLMKVLEEQLVKGESNGGN